MVIFSYINSYSFDKWIALRLELSAVNQFAHQILLQEKWHLCDISVAFYLPDRKQKIYAWIFNRKALFFCRWISSWKNEQNADILLIKKYLTYPPESLILYSKMMNNIKKADIYHVNIWIIPWARFTDDRKIWPLPSISFCIPQQPVCHE